MKFQEWKEWQIACAGWGIALILSVIVVVGIIMSGLLE